MSQAVDIEIEQGVTFELPITWYDEDGVTVRDLSSGYTAKFEIRDRPNGPLLIAFGTVAFDDAAPNILVTISDAVTSALTPRTAWYDLEVTRTAPRFVWRHARGHVLITPGVSQ